MIPVKKLNTYSITAFDPINNQLGVAVQSHWFAVGALCPWIEPGVGVIATQSLVEVSYGPKGMDLLRKGRSAQDALNILLQADKNPAVRQVAIVDAAGRTAVHTGEKCIAHAGHIARGSFSVQANMMLKDTVWGAMAEAFERSSGLLSERLFAALCAAQKEGGDIRGMQSASMKVVENINDQSPWTHLQTDIRVDDHPDPITELRRLLDLEKAYNFMNEGDDLMSRNHPQAAREKYAHAARLAPDVNEVPFWQAVTTAESGHIDEAVPIFKKVFDIDENWRELVRRLPACGLLNIDESDLDRILNIE